MSTSKRVGRMLEHGTAGAVEDEGEVEEDEDEVDGCSGMKSREKHFISITYENLQSLL